MTVLMLNKNDFGVTQLGDTTWVTVNSEISSKNYKKGDIVLVQSKKLENLNKGDEIFVYKLDRNGRPNIEVGVICIKP